VLNTLKIVPEVCRIFCATANPTEIVLAETDPGRGILSLVDGFSPKGAEDQTEIKWRKNFLRQIGPQAIEEKGKKSPERLVAEHDLIRSRLAESLQLHQPASN